MSLLATLAMDDIIYVPKTRAMLSSVAGSTSLACWIVLLLPQLIEQWKTQSADGISIGFLLIWLLGDITNLAGSIWAGLLPEVIMLAVWYCCADSLILLSYAYYKKLAQMKERKAAARSTGEEASYDQTSPLLSRSDSVTVPNGPNAHNAEGRSSEYAARRSSLEGAVSSAVDGTNIFTGIVLPILFVLACGLLGYFSSSDGEDQVIVPDPNQPTSKPYGPQILGYMSAVFYLGARIPQIYQNYRRKSVYGLSLLFFIFSVMGNLTYAAQILIFRQDKAWITLNFSWLLGSLGTIFEDAIIFIQFFKYRGNEVAIE